VPAFDEPGDSVRGLLTHFAAAWQAGRRPRLERFLAARPERERPALFVTLLTEELRARLALGERPGADEYVHRFPAFAAAVAGVYATLDAPTVSPAGVLAGPADTTAGGRTDPVAGGHSERPFPPSSWSEASTPAAAVPPDEQEEPPAAYGRYTVLGFLGKGGFGSVYLGHDGQLDRSVAIKVPRLGRRSAPDTVARFLQEARRVARLKHPGIVTIFDVGVQDGHVFLVTDYVEGASLGAKLRERRLTWQESARIAAAVADALACAHEQRIVHRDVKPSNILLTRDLAPVLLDFGLALGDEDDGVGQRDLILGTPQYMSPEQARGEGHRIDGRTDLFSLGAVLYTMLTGRPPFGATDVQELLRQVRDDDPQPPRQLVREVPRELERICLKAMAKRISDRYTTANDLADDLRRVLGGRAPGPTARPAPIAEAPESATATLHPCRQCGAVNDPDARFCGRCGVTLAAPKPPLAVEATPKPSAGGSTLTRSSESGRRQLTLFSARVSPGEGGDADPESFGAMLPHFQEACKRVVTGLGGHVAQADGDAVLVYFGYPMAFEDAARRAVRAGLAVVTAVEELNARVLPRGDAPLAVRVGVHTGLVVTGEGRDGTTRDLALVSEPRQIAARLEDLADAGQVLIGGATHKLVQGFFRCEALGPQRLKGVTKPVEAFRAVEEAAAIDRLEVAGPSGLTPLIGRDRELDLLMDRWELAREGQGQVVLLLGEPGIGKSRLLYEVKARVVAGGAPPTSVIEFRCAPQYQNSGLYPVADALERRLDFRRDTPAAERWARVERLQADAGCPPESTPLIAAILGLRSDAHPVPDVGPERLKQLTLEALLDRLRRLAARHPALLVVEDLHWIDPSTLELLNLVVDELSAERVLALFTSRPEFASPWPNRPHVTQVGLNRLTRAQVAKLVERRAGSAAVPAEVTELFLKRTDGVPLFLEELTRMALDAGVLREEHGRLKLEGAAALAGVIPDTLQDLLTARLDRLGPAKELAQVGAVLGREFSQELLAPVAERDEAALVGDLARLTEAEILFRKGRSPQASYLFKHALIQDAAYQSLLKSQRQQHHRRAADAYEARFPETALAQPELLAHHYTEAGLRPQAVAYWEKAGLLSRDRSANVEAIVHLSKGLEVLAALDDTPDRARQELRLQIPLGTALLSTKGYAAPEVGDAFARARELAHQVGSGQEQFYVLWGEWAWRVVRDELDRCMELVPEAIALAQSLNDPGLMMEALFVPGLTRVYRGEFAAARQDCEQGLALEDADRCRAHARFTGQNSAVTHRSYLALALWHMGYPQRALDLSRETLTLARSLKDPFSLCYALHHAGWLKQHCRLGAEALEHGNELVALATEQRFAFWRATGTLYRASGLLLQGRTTDGAAQVEDGLAAYRATGAKLALPYYLSFRATALIDSGRPAEALQVLDEALAIGRTTNDRFHEAELLRLRGEVSGSEADFGAAFDLARRQGSRAWELRTAVSLARRLNAANARGLVEGALAGFPEGGETPDLIEARAG
jgi:serine/threonine protein kinase/class 3 adenylate cyclase/predicted ATPase